MIRWTSEEGIGVTKQVDDIEHVKEDNETNDDDPTVEEGNELCVLVPP